MASFTDKSILMRLEAVRKQCTEKVATARVALAALKKSER
jgi:hypothetical protein